MGTAAKFRWLKWVVILLVLGAGIGGGVWYYLRAHDQKPEYRTAIVTRGELIQSVTASGQLNPMLNVLVGSQISGIILKLYADFNSSVTQNQVVAQLDPATYRAAVQQNEGDLASAKAGLELLQINARRAAELRKSELISQSEYETTMANLHQAEAAVVIREATLLRAQVDLARCTIYAPIDGVVISRNVDVGQTVAASLSAPTLFVIANDLANMQIDAMVSEADIGGLEEGQSVNFTVDAFPYRTFQGSVKQVRNAPSTNQNVVTYDCVVAVDNRDLKLKPGMTANVKITVAKRDDTLMIPNAALRVRPPETGDSKKIAAGPVSTSPPAVPPRAASRTGSNETASSMAAGDSGTAAERVPEFLLKRFDKNKDGKLDDAEREEMRKEMRGKSGGRGSSGGSGGGGGAGRSRGDRPMTRTVYTLTTNETNGKLSAQLKPVQIKMGISDGALTEVTEGLKEGDTIVVGISTPQPAAGSQQPPANPFGGGQRRF